MKLLFSQNKVTMCILLLLVLAAFTGCAYPTTNDSLYSDDEPVQEKFWKTAGELNEDGNVKEIDEREIIGEKEQQKAEIEANEGGSEKEEHKAGKEKDISSGNSKKTDESDKTKKDSLTQEKSDEKKLAEKSKVIVTIEGPSDVGTILGAVTVELQEGDTVMDILQKITREERMQMEFRGRGSGAYVEGINNLYEFDQGPGSGWMYSVNGYFPNRGSGAWKVEAGDQIQWHYTKDLGRDLGVGPQGGRPEENND